MLNFGLAGSNALLLPFAAIAGALLATLLLAFAAARINSTVTLLLIGVGLSSFATAMIALLMNLAPNPFTLADMINWMLGSVANRSLEDILRAGPFLLVGVVCLLFVFWRSLRLGAVESPCRKNIAVRRPFLGQSPWIRRLWLP